MGMFLSLIWSLTGCEQKIASKSEAGISGVRQTPVVNVVREWSSSVVNISTERVVLVQANPFLRFYGGLLNEFYDSLLSVPVGAMRLNSLGSGVVLSDDGVIVTNAHVVNFSSRIFCIFSDKEEAEAQVLAVDAENDLALIRIKSARKLKPLRLAKDVLIGETVVSIGNPIGLENSVSSGIISGLNRQFRVSEMHAFEDLIQTDAPINFGSSGGALLNLEGDLVGVNLAIIEGAQNIGFAVPFEKVRRLLEQYRQRQEERTS